MQFETWLKTDITKLCSVVTLDGVVFSQDDMANLVGVEVYEGEDPVTLSGTVVGYIIRDDGATVSVNGQTDGNKAWIVLPESAYAVVGAIKIALRLTDGSEKTTLGVCVGSVQRTSTDTIVDPGHVIPSLDELLAQLDACIQATEAATDAAAALDGLTVDAAGSPSQGAPTATVTKTGGHYNISFGLVPSSISSQSTAYQNSSSGTVIPSGTWLDTQPVTPQGQYLWSRRTIVWSSGQTTEIYTISRMGVDGSGSVVSVNGESPDGSGNVTLPTDSTPTANSTNYVTSGGVKAALQDLINVIYPVGSVYMSFGSTSPATLFGGTWEQLEECFLFASGGNYAVGDHGGEAEHVLTQSELPVTSGTLKMRAWGSGDPSIVQSATGVFSQTDITDTQTGQTMTGSGNYYSKKQQISFNLGSGAGHNNMPPYQVVNMWRRTA